MAPVAKAVIPSKYNCKTSKTFDKVDYRERNHVERSFGRIKKPIRRIATCYEKQQRTSWRS